MANRAFSIAYDGPALKTGEMPVRDLAPALLALGNLFTEASQVLYPENKPVALNIKATERGSFDVQLILQGEDLWDQFVDVFSADAATALTNLWTIVAASSVGVLAVLKWLGGRPIEREDPAPTPGHVRITAGDTSIEIPADVARMVRRVSIRRKARDVVAPLNREGVDELRFSESQTEPPVLVIDKADVAAYEAAAVEEGEILLDEEREQIVQIASVSFEGGKWRLSDGTVTFWASIEDDEFLADVDANRELFGKGDMLRCLMRYVQLRRPAGGLRSEYYVIKVLKHMPTHMQPQLWETTLPEIAPDEQKELSDGGEPNAAA